MDRVTGLEPAKGSEAQDRVFELAAELFALLSTPTRLRIVCELARGEKNVGELLQRVAVSQSNISQHLGVLYRSGVLGRRREGVQMYYRIASQRVLLLCEAVCQTQSAHGARSPQAVGSPG
jgi:DNA-binding transcriptional ArsR family regulator